jgi:hypothetical protein
VSELERLRGLGRRDEEAQALLEEARGRTQESGAFAFFRRIDTVLEAL